MIIFSKKLVFATATFLLIGVTSCNKLCDEGYEGKRCDEEIRANFVATWVANDNPGGYVFTDTLSRGTGILDILIQSRFGADTFSRVVNATISGNTINIARQKPVTLKPLYIEGTGTISNDGKNINWNYDLINTGK